MQEIVKEKSVAMWQIDKLIEIEKTEEEIR